MSNPQPQRQLLSFARNCWPLVPVITVFGMISGILGLAFDFFPTPWLDAQSLYIPLGSLCLGLSLGAALWLCGVVRTWTALATIAGATIAGHVLELCVVLYLHSRNIPTPMGDLASGPIALVLYAVVLLLIRPNTRRGRSLLVAAGCAGLAAVTIGACNEIAAETLNFPLLGFPLSPMWQTAVAFFLGVAVAANQAWDSASVATEGFEQTRMPLPKRLAPVAVLAVCFAVLIGLRNRV